MIVEEPNPLFQIPLEIQVVLLKGKENHETAEKEHPRKHGWKKMLVAWHRDFPELSVKAIVFYRFIK